VPPILPFLLFFRSHGPMLRKCLSLEVLSQTFFSSSLSAAASDSVRALARRTCWNPITRVTARLAQDSRRLVATEPRSRRANVKTSLAYFSNLVSVHLFSDLEMAAQAHSHGSGPLSPHIRIHGIPAGAQVQAAVAAHDTTPCLDI
jgi:hypothetical protein